VTLAPLEREQSSLVELVFVGTSLGARPEPRVTLKVTPVGSSALRQSLRVIGTYGCHTPASVVSF